MVVKILRVKDSNGNLIEDSVCLMNKSGSFSKVYKSNIYIDNLIKRYGTPIYVNVTFNGNDIDVKGLVSASF